MVALLWFLTTLVFSFAANTGLAQTAAHQVELKQSLHFPDPDGKLIQVPPGLYEVRPLESGQLQLSQPGKHPLILQAQEGSHTKEITQPEVALVPNPEEPTEINLALWLPEGMGLEVLGSTTGVQSRAARFLKFRLFRPRIRFPGLKRAVPFTAGKLAPIFSNVPCIPGAQKVFTKGRLAVALVLDTDIKANLVEGNSVAPGRCFQTLSLNEFLNQLQILNNQKIAIATLSIISHGALGLGTEADVGVLFFEKGNIFQRKISLTNLAKEIKKKLPNGFKNPPNRVSLRGCRVGAGDPDSLNALRKAIGALFLEASNCFTVPQPLGSSITIPGVKGPITRLSQLRNTKDLNSFKLELDRRIKTGFEKTPINSFGFSRSASKCIVGLHGPFPRLIPPPIDKNRKPGDEIDDRTLLYFLNRGDLAAVWTTPPPRNRSFFFNSKCFHELKTVKAGTKIFGGCKLVEVGGFKLNP